MKSWVTFNFATDELKLLCFDSQVVWVAWQNGCFLLPSSLCSLFLSVMFTYLCCRLYFFSFSFPVISNSSNDVWHRSCSVVLEMCSFRKYSSPLRRATEILSGWGAKEAVSEGVWLGSCSFFLVACGFIRLSRSNCSREVQNRISLQATKLCSNSEARFFDNGWERLLKTSTLGSSS